jgi:copper chaperone CopZ
MKFEKSAIGLSILTALASSLCCITPILALLAGTSGLASNFSWIEPIRPYLVGSTFVILGFAWYQKLKPQPKIADCCQTEENRKSSFIQSKKFLGIVTTFAVLLTAFPYYSNKLIAATENTIKHNNTELVEFKVSGMTCESCEHHITSEVNKLAGIQSVKASYANNNTTIEFDPKQVNINQIQQAIDSTGYQAEEYKIIKK